MHSVYGDPAYAAITGELTGLLHDLQAAVGDRPYLPDDVALPLLPHKACITLLRQPE